MRNTMRVTSLVRHFSNMVKITRKDLERMAKKGISMQDLDRFTTERQDRKEGVKQAVETMFFDNTEEREVRDYLKEISQQQLTPGDDTSRHQWLGYQLSEAEEAEMMKLGSVRSSKIENTEQLEKKLRSIKYNPRLLGVFLKNIRMVKDGTYAVLYDRLVKNLELNKEAEIEEKFIWEERRSRLQRINPRLDLRFRFDPTSLKSVLEDPKYQIVKGIYLKRLESKKDQLGTVAFGCLQVIKLEGDLTPDFKNALMESLKGFDPSSVAENHLGGLISSTLSILYKLRSKNEIDNAVSRLNVGAFTGHPRHLSSL